MPVLSGTGRNRSFRQYGSFDFVPGKFQIEALYFQFVLFIHIQDLIQFLVVSEQNLFSAYSLLEINFAVNQASLCFYIIIKRRGQNLDIGSILQLFQVKFKILTPVQVV